MKKHERFWKRPWSSPYKLALDVVAEVLLRMQAVAALLNWFSLPLNERKTESNGRRKEKTWMGVIVEFYSAEPQALVVLFAAEVDEESDERFFEQLKAFPIADFSLHLQLPEDFDSLCQLLSQQDRRIPPIFRDLCVEQIWDDGPVVTESLTTLADVFAESLAELSEQFVEDIARDWTATFPDQEPFWQTPAYRAVWQLRAVAQDAVERRRSLVLHLAGHPLF